MRKNQNQTSPSGGASLRLQSDIPLGGLGRFPLRALFRGLLCMLALSALPLHAQDSSETGLWMSAEAQKKLSKQWSVSGEAEYRLRENLGSTDRWTVALSAAYKPVGWLKFDAGYKFMRVLNDDESSFRDDGTLKKFTPSWWCTKHRFFASATGTLSAGRLDLSLRERWQYTYRPETTVDRYDNIEEEWEDKTKDGKASHVLRSRLQAEYNIPSCKVDPFASVELYNQSGGLQKVRYTIGADWKISKKHQLSLFYRFVDEKNSDDPDRHVIGLGYKVKL